MIKLAICAKRNGRYIEVAVIQKTGLATVYCTINLSLEKRLGLEAYTHL